jgi:hypothetical protein
MNQKKSGNCRAKRRIGWNVQTMMILPQILTSQRISRDSESGKVAKLYKCILRTKQLDYRSSFVGIQLLLRELGMHGGYL